MTPSSEQLERLITRFLDDECSPAERRELRRMIRRDPAAEALLDEYSALDRELGIAIRRSMGRSIDVGVRRSRGRVVGRVAGMAVAAGLALALWLGDARLNRGGPGKPVERAGQAGWFAPAGPVGDTTEEAGWRYEQPHIPVRDTRQDWILIPGERPGEYMVIEVRRSATREVRIYGDF